jgi:hypothetical protein
MAILIVFFQHGKELRYNNFMDVTLLNIEVEKVLKIYISKHHSIYWKHEISYSDD